MDKHGITIQLQIMFLQCLTVLKTGLFLFTQKHRQKPWLSREAKRVEKKLKWSEYDRNCYLLTYFRDVKKVPDTQTQLRMSRLPLISAFKRTLESLMRTTFTFSLTCDRRMRSGWYFGVTDRMILFLYYPLFLSFLSLSTLLPPFRPPFIPPSFCVAACV